jgi:Argininosuccinate lyase
MWGGRFTSGPAEIMQRINASIGVDRRLWRQDIAGSRAHAAMLVRQGILRQADGEAIALGLDQIEKEIADGRFAFKVELEDIHTNIESRLRELIGAPAGRLHTARSRNDQVAVDFRLWLREAIDGLDAQLVELTEAFLDRAEEHAATIMPGFTHLQVAQPVTFGHHLLAYVEMLSRDRGRLADCRGRLTKARSAPAHSPAPAFPSTRRPRPPPSASRGRWPIPWMPFRPATSPSSSWPPAPSSPPIFRASPRSWYSGPARASASWPWAMPSPPAARSCPRSATPMRRAGARQGGTGHRRLVQLLVVLKGLPLTYGKDMQEDKETVFLTVDNLSLSLAAMTGMVRDLTADTGAMRQACDRGFITATDLADGLVRDLGLAFREAHHITGTLVRLAEQKGCGLAELPLAEMQRIEPRITAETPGRSHGRGRGRGPHQPGRHGPGECAARRGRGAGAAGHKRQGRGAPA